MKEFNLEAALAGEPVVTRDGQKIIEIHYFKYVKSKFPLVVHIENNSSVDHYTIKGKWTDDFENEELDLFMAEPEKWVSVYYDKEKGEAFCGTFLFNSLEDAKEICESHAMYQTTIKINL
jgi:hypothetical protein